MKIVCKILILAIIVLFSGEAISSENHSPEELVLLYYKHMATHDMNTLAGYMHSKALNNIKEMLLPFLKDALNSNEASGLLFAFTQGDTLKQIKEYSPQKFFSRFLLWILSLKPDMDTILKTSSIKPIGHISENDIAHVVFRMTSDFKGMRISKLSVMSLRKEGNKWKFLLTGEIEGIAQALQRQTNTETKDGSTKE